MEVNTSIDYRDLYEQSQLRILTLEQQLAQLQKMIFGSRHERYVPAESNPSQLTLGMQTESVAACNVGDAKKITYIRSNTTIEQKPLQHPGRMKLPEHLRREEIIIEPTQDITDCKKMGEEITEVLEYAPGELFVKQYKRIKYAKPGGEGVLIGELPVRPLEKAMAGAGLLAQRNKFTSIFLLLLEKVAEGRMRLINMQTTCRFTARCSALKEAALNFLILPLLIGSAAPAN